LDYLEKLNKAIGQWQGLIGGFVALVVAAIAGIVAIRSEFIKLNPLSWSWLELAIALSAVSLLVGVALRTRSVNASRLLDPDALRLDPRSPEQLIGRGADLEKLLNALASPLVFLVSESGCGKSALLRAGVVRGPAFNERFLPIYIDMSVLDWEDQPLAAIVEGFARSLPVDDPARGKLDARSGVRAISEVFAEYSKRVHRRPLVLLDQFDDYQARPQHRDRFLPAQTRIWRTAREIAPENAFWRVLRQCVHSDTARIVAACREDAVKGLESLRFIPDVPQFDLPRLEPGLVRLIIDRLTERPADKPPIIANPQGGWTALRDRLADDIERRGDVLPQQLKLILAGLRTLKRLTPGAYARVGRVAGLEAAFVVSALGRAARVAGLRDDETVLGMVAVLIDRTRQPPDKSAPLTTRALADIVGIADEIAARALTQLEADEVVRKATGGEAATAWQLDHAYLAQPVLRIERERGRWLQLLSDSARACAEASWRSWWSTLLPIRSQVQLLAARLRGRFRYGIYKGYALKSLARVLPFIAGLALMAGLSWTLYGWDAAARIEAQLTVRHQDNSLSDDAARGLDDLAAAGWVTRRRVASDVFQSPVHAEWFVSSAERVARALVRLDPDRLDSMVRENVTLEALSQPDPRLRFAVAALANATSLEALGEPTRAAFERVFLQALGGTSNAVELGAIGAALSNIAAALPNGDLRVAQWLTALRGAIGRTTSGAPTLAQAYAAAAPRLKDGDPRAADELAALHEAIGKTTDNLQLSALTEAYAAMAPKLKDGNLRAADVLAALRAAVAKTTDIYQLSTLSHAYALAAPRLKDGDPLAAEVLAALRAAIAKTTDSYQLSTLSHAYAAVAPTVKDGDPRAADVLAALHGAIAKTTDANRLSDLVQAYAAAPNLKDGDPRAADVLVVLRNVIMKTIDAEQISPLAQAYVAAAPKLNDGASRTADELAALRDAIAETIDGDQLSALAQAYEAVAPKLKDGDSRAADELSALRDVIEKSDDGNQLWVAGRAYAALAPKLKAGDPRGAGEVAALRNAIAKTTDRYQLAALARAYAAVVTSLNDGDSRAAEVLAALHDAFPKATYSSHLHDLAHAYAALVPTLKDGDPRAADALAVLRDSIAKTTDSDDLSELALAYAAVVRVSRPSGPLLRDLAILLQRMKALRSVNSCVAFAAAIREASLAAQPPLSSDKVGLIYAAALLEPVCAGPASRMLVSDYEGIVRQRPGTLKLGNSWAGDVWAFAKWAQANLPNFDRHRARVEFLPAVN
jgi:hypothetical protein